MRKRMLALLMALAMTVGMLPTTARAAEAYVTISTVDELKAFRDSVNNGNSYEGKTVTLTANLDLNEENWTPIGWSSNQYSVPSFKGTFDGGFHTIYNLTIDTSCRYCGLFGKLQNAAIKNLGIENADITSSVNDVAALAGNAQGGTISRCYVTGTVKGKGAVSGILGSTHSSDYTTQIDNCYARIAIIENGTYTDDLAGISGWNEATSVSITNCFSACTGEIRPIAGWSDGSAVKNSQFANTYFDSTLSPNFSTTAGRADLGKTSDELKTQSTYVDWDFAAIWDIEDGKNGGYPYLKGFTPGLGGAPGSITVTVKDSDNKPVTGAEVILKAGDTETTLSEERDGVYSGVVTTTGETYDIYLGDTKVGTVSQTGSNAANETVTAPSGEGNDPAHTHNWAEAWTTDDTHHWHECIAEDCDVEDFSDVDGSGYAEHSKTRVNTDETQHWQKCEECGWESARADHSGGTATCTAQAVCEGCGQSYGELASDNHAQALTHHDGVPATCTEAGTVEYWSCGDCRKIFSDENGMTKMNEIPTIPATRHDWDNWGITTNPTTEATGTAERVCKKNSDHKETATLPVLTDTEVWAVEEDENGSQIYTSIYGTVTVTPSAHTHAWAETWEKDDTHHWHACTADDCDVTDNADKDGYGEHVWDDDQDTDCSTCGYTRTVAPTEPHTHDGVTFTAWNDPGSLPTGAGNYYLTTDVAYPASSEDADRWNVPGGEIHLCLNGHSISKAIEGSSVTCTMYIDDAAADMTLYNCGSEGSVSGDRTIYMPNGTLTLKDNVLISGTAPISLGDPRNRPNPLPDKPAALLTIENGAAVSASGSTAVDVDFVGQVIMKGGRVSVTEPNSACVSAEGKESFDHFIMEDGVLSVRGRNSAALSGSGRIEGGSIIKYMDEGDSALLFNVTDQLFLTGSPTLEYRTSDGAAVTQPSLVGLYIFKSYNRFSTIDAEGYTGAAITVTTKGGSEGDDLEAGDVIVTNVAPETKDKFTWKNSSPYVAQFVFAYDAEARALVLAEESGGEEPAPTYAVSGAVTDSSGAAVAGAEVKLVNKDGQVVAAMTTGADGQYSFTGVAPGEYDIVVTKDGVTTTTQVTVNTDMTNLTLTITTTPPAADTYTISGTVTDSDDAAVEGAAVRLMRGKTLVDSTTTDGDGNYSFTNVAPGSYNVVAEQARDGRTKTMTILVTVTNASLSDQNLKMPSDNVNSILEVTGDDTPDVAVGGLEAEAESHKEAGKTVTVTMTVEGKEENAAANADEIKAAAGEGKKLEYLEITVKKTVEADGSETTDPISTTNNLLTIVIPFDFNGKIRSSVAVYRYHDGSADTLTEAANTDEEKIELGTDSITLYVRNFSTYAIGYAEDVGTYTVTFDSQGGSAVDSQTVARGGMVTKPADPARNGYSFGGWYKEPACTTAWNFGADTVTGDMTLYAGWTSRSDDPIDYGGGDSGNYDPPVYPISVPGGTSGGTVNVDPKDAGKGTTVTIIATPDEGYEISEVTVTDRNSKEIPLTDEGNGRYTFTMPAGRVTVSAGFAKIKESDAGTPEEDYTCPRDYTCPIWSYTDASVTAWYHDGVHYCIENGLMSGDTSDTFRPDGDTSRAMIATILWRLEGRPVVNYILPFDDVAEGAWYTEAIRWAAASGVVGGYGNGKFGPDDPITREQLAAMLYRYEQYKGGGFTGVWMFPTNYTDAELVSSWAREPMSWTITNGIMEGIGNGLLDPQGKATRAQTAVMIMRFCEKK